MYKSLIIGCGNIGAMYDFENDSIATYAKAFHLDPEIEFEVFDVDLDVSLRIADRYSVRSLSVLSPATFQDYDIVVISASTSAHFQYLSLMLERGPHLVICEKPVDTDISRLAQLRTLYHQANIKVMVNFFRRFQPGFVQLKLEIEDILSGEQCTNIVVKYQRGFHNNASHAFDLLEFIFGATIDLSQASIARLVRDEFENDPTLNMSCVWNGMNVEFIGLAGVHFSHFEIELFFVRKAVLIKDGGNVIERYSASPKSGDFYSKLCLQSKQGRVIENYMVNVIYHAKKLLSQGSLGDNFLQSVNISERILELQGR